MFSDFSSLTLKSLLKGVLFYCLMIGHTFSAEPPLLEPFVNRSQTLHFKTIHGPLTIDDPLAIALIQTPVMQRLKGIYQYGIMERIHPSSPSYTRFDHCLGVYQILKMHGASQKELIAGLLHDVSHTVFSHLTDMLFLKSFAEESYQDTIHAQFLKAHGIQEILKDYDLCIHDILPDNKEFLRLEQLLPTLCADRIEYNLHAGYLTNLLSLSEIQEIHQHLHFDGQNWYFDDPAYAEKLAKVSVHQTVYNWSSPKNMVASKWVCEAINILRQEGYITEEGIHYTYSDIDLWHTLEASQNGDVKNLIAQAKSAEKYFKLVSDQEVYETFKFKSRALNPWVMVMNKLYRLTDLKSEYRQEFEKLANMANTGWRIMYLKDNINESKS